MAKTKRQKPKRRYRHHAQYRCARCGRFFWRVSDKQWIKSYCDATDGVAHLQRVRGR